MKPGALVTKNRLIKNFKMAATEHRALVSLGSCTGVQSAALETSPGHRLGLVHH